MVAEGGDAACVEAGERGEEGVGGGGGGWEFEDICRCGLDGTNQGDVDVGFGSIET